MYIPTQFFNKPQIQIEYLIVGGGGGGGFYPFVAGVPNTYGGPSGGGGGAGGFVSGSMLISLGNAYPIIVGNSGSAGNGAFYGTNGGNSSAFSITAYGGGYGGHQISLFDSIPGNSGSSGGGEGREFAGTGSAIYGSQGKNGGFYDYYAFAGNGLYSGGGGGGGASVSGGNAFQVGGSLGKIQGGSGGNGKAWVDGNFYAGGGGGGAWSTSTTSADGGVGGIGGGGQGASKGLGVNAGTGSPNTGGGGGGGSAAGGSGIVKLRYPSSEPKFIGGTISSGSGYIYHTFNSSSILYTYTSLFPPLPPIYPAVSQSLKSYIDIAYTASYNGSGSILTDLTRNEISGTLDDSSAWIYDTTTLSTPVLRLQTTGSASRVRLPNITVSGSYALAISVYNKNVKNYTRPEVPLFQTNPDSFATDVDGLINFGSDEIYSSIEFDANPSLFKIQDLITSSWNFYQVSYDSVNNRINYAVNGLTGSYTSSTSWSVNSSEQFNVFGAGPNTGGGAGVYGTGSMVQFMAVYTGSLSTSQMLQNYNAISGRYI